MAAKGRPEEGKRTKQLLPEGLTSDDNYWLESAGSFQILF